MHMPFFDYFKEQVYKIQGYMCSWYKNMVSLQLTAQKVERDYTSTGLWKLFQAVKSISSGVTTFTTVFFYVCMIDCCILCFCLSYFSIFLSLHLELIYMSQLIRTNFN